MNENNLDLTENQYVEECEEEEEVYDSQEFDEMAHFRCMLPY